MKTKARMKSNMRMDFIDNKKTFAAVMYAIKMIREGIDPGLANARAARYYARPISEVAKYVGQHASRTKNARRNYA